MVAQVTTDYSCTLFLYSGVVGVHDGIVAVNGVPLGPVEDPGALPNFIAPLPRPLRITFHGQYTNTPARRATVSPAEHAAAAAAAAAALDALAAEQHAAPLVRTPPTGPVELLDVIQRQDAQLKQQSKDLKVATLKYCCRLLSSSFRNQCI